MELAERIALRKIAMEEQKQKEKNMLSFHLFVFEKLNSHERDIILKKANERLDLWSSEKLCSRFYIEEWAPLLQLDLSAFENEILKNSNNNSNALMQNTPFYFLKQDFYGFE